MALMDVFTHFSIIRRERRGIRPEEIKSLIVQKLGLRVEITELAHPDGRVLVFEVPTRPTGQPMALLVSVWKRGLY
jgi:hypothetical protein